MKRRFLQFSLRRLLGLAALVCLLLGGRHLLETYGNSLDVENVKGGATVRVKTRFFRVLGPSEFELEVGYHDGVHGPLDYCNAKRYWLCLYTMEAEFELEDGAPRLTFYSCLYEKSGVGKVWQEKIVDVK